MTGPHDTDRPPAGEPAEGEGEPIPRGLAQLAVTLALADVNRALVRLADVALAVTRALDATANPEGTP